MFNRKNTVHLQSRSIFQPAMLVYQRPNNECFIFCKASRKPSQPRRQSTYQQYWRPLKANDWLVGWWSMQCLTLPKTNVVPENRVSQKERIIFQPLIFGGYVSFREGKNICQRLVTTKLTEPNDNEIKVSIKN